MKKKMNKFFGISIIMMVLFVISPVGLSGTIESTELKIDNVRGGLGAVTVDVKNIGTETATDITIIMSVKGGIIGNIDILKECSGCSSCGTTLEPNAIKTENTGEEEFIIGFGSIDIYISASASNAEEVTQSLKGLVIGPFVLIN